MTVLLRPALAGGTDPLVGALLTILPALGVGVVAAIVAGEIDFSGLWPFALAGMLGPGVSQLLFTLAVRDAGPSRSSAAVGTAPLFAIAFAVVLLGEPLAAGVLGGAALIVAGGVLLAGERDRPVHVKPIGLAFAVGACLAFAARDTLVRWLAIDSDLSPQLAMTTTLAAGAATVAAAVLVMRRPVSFGALRAFALPGLVFGLSYLCLFEAFYRGRLSVVSPLVATESLWGVLLSAIFLRHEGVSRRLAAGAVVVVAGGVLIGLTR